MYQPWKLEKAGSQSDLGNAHPNSIQGGGCWPDYSDSLVRSLSFCWDSCNSTKSAVLTYLNHLPQNPLLIWLVVTSTQGGANMARWPEETSQLFHIPGSPNSYIKPLYSHHTYYTPIMIYLHFSSFLKKLYVTNSFLLTLLYSTIKLENFYLNFKSSREGKYEAYCYHVNCYLSKAKHYPYCTSVLSS